MYTSRNSKTISSLKSAASIKILILIAIIVTGGTVTYNTLRLSSTKQNALSAAVNRVAEPEFVTALGRLEPKGEVIKLSAPTSSGEVSRVQRLLVQQGSKVKAWQVVAILDSRDRLQAAVEKAQEDVKVDRARLAQIKAGAKSGEIQAKTAEVSRTEAEGNGQIATTTATISRLNAELNNAQVEYKRYQLLYTNGAISASMRDSKLLTVKTVTQQLNETKANLQRIKGAQKQQVIAAKAILDQIKEVRAVDVQVAQATVRSSQTAVKTAQANLDLAYVRATRDGQILKIHTFPGELIGQEGIVELGKTDEMYVIAEVYETDVTKIKRGQSVVITSNAFPDKLKGTVNEIGLQIGKNDILKSDPTTDTDSRVVEVKIILDANASQKVSGLTNLQVTAAIQTGS